MPVLVTFLCIKHWKCSVACVAHITFLLGSIGPEIGGSWPGMAGKGWSSNAGMSRVQVRADREGFSRTMSV